MSTSNPTTTITIDPDIGVSDLIESYINGNITYVLNALSSDHAGLTAIFITEYIRRECGDVDSLNSLVNRLIDNRVKLSN